MILAQVLSIRACNAEGQEAGKHAGWPARQDWGGERLWVPLPWVWASGSKITSEGLERCWNPGWRHPPWYRLPPLPSQSQQDHGVHSQFPPHRGGQGNLCPPDGFPTMQLMEQLEEYHRSAAPGAAPFPSGLLESQEGKCSVPPSPSHTHMAAVLPKNQPWWTSRMNHRMLFCPYLEKFTVCFVSRQIIYANSSLLVWPCLSRPRAP